MTKQTWRSSLRAWVLRQTETTAMSALRQKLRLAALALPILAMACNPDQSSVSTPTDSQEGPGFVNATDRMTVSDVQAVGIQCSFSEQSIGAGTLITFGDSDVAVVRNTKNLATVGSLKHSDIVTHGVRVSGGYVTASGMSTVTTWNEKKLTPNPGVTISFGGAPTSVTNLLTDDVGKSVLVETMEELQWFPTTQLNPATLIRISPPGTPSDIGLHRTQFAPTRKEFLVSQRTATSIHTLPVGGNKTTSESTGERYEAIQDIGSGEFLLINSTGQVYKYTGGKAKLIGSIPFKNDVLYARCLVGSQWWIAARNRLYIVDASNDTVYHAWDAPSGNITGLAVEKDGVEETVICGYGHPRGFLCKLKFVRP